MFFRAAFLALAFSTTAAATQASSGDLAKFKTADALWDYTLDQVMSVKFAEKLNDHQKSKKLLPFAQAAVVEFISRYPGDREVWAAREWKCDLGLIANHLGIDGAPDLDEIVTGYESLSRDGSADKHARGLAKARALLIQLNRIQGKNVPPQTVKTIGAEVAEFDREFGPELIFNHHDFALEIRSLYALKGKPVEFKFVSVDGVSVDVAKLRGKVLLIYFWATWCGNCINETPALVDIYRKYRGQGLEIVGVCLDEDRNTLLKFTAAHGMTWREYLVGKDQADEIRRTYGIQGVPVHWLIDRQGMLITTTAQGDLAGQVEKALAAK